MGSAAYVHNAAVDVAKLLEAKEPRAMSRVIEDERLWQLDGIAVERLTYGGGIDGHSTSVGGRVWFLASSRSVNWVARHVRQERRYPAWS
jgi:hypothetical protein